MLSIGNVGEGQLGSYYKKDDYYTEIDLEIEGSGKNEFELSKDSFDEKKFIKLVEDREKKNKARKDLKAKDLTFSAPKSVSLFYGLGDKKTKSELLACHTKAVKEVIEHIEKAGMFWTRIKQDGIAKYCQAEGMVAAMFKHEVNRNQDYDLHTHALIANVCKDKITGESRAVDYRGIFKNVRNLGFLYNAYLMQFLKEKGYKYQITNKKHLNFELAGVDDRLLKLFSSRRQEILDFAKENGLDINDFKSMQFANKVTRKKKEGVTKEKIFEAHIQKIKQAGLDINSIKPEKITNKLSIKNEPIYLKKYIKQGIAELEEKHSVFAKEDILFAAAKQFLAAEGKSLNFNPDIILKEIDKNSELIKIPCGKDDLPINVKYTTKTILDAETNIKNSVINVKSVKALVDDLNKKIKSYQTALKKHQGFKLNKEQVNAVKTILEKNSHLTCIQGLAGTGKTTMLKCVNEVYDNPQKILGISFQGKAAQNLENESGIKSSTVHSFLQKVDSKNPQTINTIKNGLLIVDEASTLGTIQMSKLCDIAKRYNTRISFIGDKKQFLAVSAGDPFSAMQDYGIKTCGLEDIRRQKNPELLEVVKDIAGINPFKKEEGIKNAIERFKKSKTGDLHYEIIKNKRERLNKIGDFYIKHRKLGYNDLVITARNNDRDYLNNKIRKSLIKNEILKGEESVFNLVDTDGEPVRKKIMVGENILFLKNDNKLEVKNGITGVVKNINESKQKIEIEFNLNNEKKKVTVDTKSYKKLDYAYAVTGHKSQGQTYDGGIYDANSKSSMSRNAFYVGPSRFRKRLMIFTDNEKNLIKQASNFQIKQTALKAFENISGKPEKENQNTNQTRKFLSEISFKSLQKLKSNSTEKTLTDHSSKHLENKDFKNLNKIFKNFQIENLNKGIQINKSIK